MVKKRVLHVVEAAGGVERYLVALLTKMKNYKEFEHILICSNSFDKAKFKHLVSSIEIIDSMQNALSFSLDAKAIVGVRKEIIKYKPDIVYCHSSKAGAIGRIADVGIKNRLVYNAHGWSFNMKDISNIKRLFYTAVECLLSRITDVIVCISEYERKSAIEHRVCKEDKLVVINNGIDFDEYRNIHPKSREELRIPRDAFVVGSIGRICTQKASDIFVKMAEEVKKQIPESFFIIVGDDLGTGELRKEIVNELALANMIDSFLITGWVDNPLDYVGLFDVAVHLSRWEGFGLVLPEYMMFEKPIVATNIDAIPYVVGEAGLLVTIDDYLEAAKAVVKFYSDDELKLKKIEKGIERIMLFDVQRTADEHIELFTKLV